MTSFQDTPDEAMEDDEAMEVRSTRNSKLHWMFHLELLQQILSIAKVETFFPRNSDSFFGLIVAVRLGWANFRFLVELGLSADPHFLSFLSNPLGHPPFSSTWQSSQRSQLLFGFRLDAQDLTTAFVEHFLDVVLTRNLLFSCANYTRDGSDFVIIVDFYLFSQSCG